MRRVGIASLGAYVPPKILTNKDLEKMVDTSDEWITTRTGIKERRIADESQASSDLAYEASKIALAEAGIEPSDLDMIIVCGVTFDYPFPATACILQDRLGANKAGAMDIEAGCTGFIYALSVAYSYVACGFYDNVLVVGSDVLSKVTDWQDRSSCILFGDAAGAAVVTPYKGQGELLNFYLRSDGSRTDDLLIPAGGSRNPASHKTVEERLHYMKLNGPEVFRLAVRVIEDAVTAILNKAQLKKEDIAILIPHQANIRIIQTAARNLAIPQEKFFVNVDRYGNTSAASIPLAFYEALKEGRIKKGDYIILVGFGAGLTWGAFLIRW
ncbi:ketoacyl-ACP synthase III [bacterium]|nr:ketoacyl-ACP synthase III [bacterium]